MRKLTTVRNREIFAAYQAGQSANMLALKYGLSLATLKDVVTAEKLRRALSVEGFYKQLRRVTCPQPYTRD
jgi:Mor family transcriptional regulator